MALKDLFSSIADAIREKDGTTAEITASTFPDRIRAIPTGVGGVQLESISITTPPAKTEYVVGETFDPTSMVVQATFSNGQTMLVSNSNLTFDPSGELSADTTAVTVNFQLGLKMVYATQAITVVDWRWWSPQMTSDTTPAPYVASASSEYKDHSDRLYYSYYAFDGKHGNIMTSTEAVAWYSDVTPLMIMLDCGKEMTIKGVRLFPDVSSENMWIGFPKAFKLMGSADGDSYTDIVDINYSSAYQPSSKEWYELLLDSPVSYRYYKFIFYKGSYAYSSQVVVGEIEFYTNRVEEVTTE